MNRIEKGKTENRISGLLPLFLFIGLALLPSCARRSEPQTDPARLPLAIVGEDSITVFQFQRSYESAMLRSAQTDNIENRRLHLQRMIDGFLLAQEALEDHLDTAAGYTYQREMSEREAMRELVYSEIRESVAIDEQDLREAFQRSRESRYVRHLFAADEDRIRRYYRELLAGEKSFAELAKECFRDQRLQANGGALGWISWGDTDLAFENVAYMTVAGSVSEPFRSKFGWHIVRVDHIKKNLLPTQWDYEQFRVRNRAKVQKIFAEEELARHLSEFMQKQKLQLNVRLMKQIATEIRDFYSDILHPENVRLQGLPLSGVESLTLRLQDVMEANLVTHRGGEWTVAEFVYRIPELPLHFVTDDFEKAVAFALRNDLLAEEAYADGMHQRAELRERVKLSSYDWLAHARSQRIWDAIPEEQHDYFSSEDIFLYKLQRWRKQRNDYLEALRARESITLFPQRLEKLYTNTAGMPD